MSYHISLSLPPSLSLSLSLSFFFSLPHSIIRSANCIYFSFLQISQSFCISEYFSILSLYFLPIFPFSTVDMESFAQELMATMGWSLKRWVVCLGLLTHGDTKWSHSATIFYTKKFHDAGNVFFVSASYEVVTNESFLLGKDLRACSQWMQWPWLFFWLAQLPPIKKLL